MTKLFVELDEETVKYFLGLHTREQIENACIDTKYKQHSLHFYDACQTALKQDQKWWKEKIAYAEGKTIEVKGQDNVWREQERPLWCTWLDYRIKSEPKPDIVKYLESDMLHGGWYETDTPTSIKIIRDGETGKVKSCEVVG